MGPGAPPGGSRSPARARRPVELPTRRAPPPTSPRSGRHAGARAVLRDSDDSNLQGRREPSVARTLAARAFASTRSAFNAPALSLESLCFLRAFEMAAIEALSAAELFLTR